MTRTLNRSIAVGLAALLCHGLAAAQTETTAERWQRELAENRALLLARDWSGALEPSRRLLEELMADLKGGPGSAELVAVALAQLGLAEAGVERHREALWHLRCAAIFNPAIGATSLGEEFGPVGARLDGWRAEPTLATQGPPPATGSSAGGLHPPRIVAGNFIILRASVEQLQLLDPELEVAFVIDDRGRIVEPRVHGRLDNPAPILLSLEVLLEFRFEPARYRGRPIAVAWKLPLPLTQSVVRKAVWDLKRDAIESLLRDRRWQAALDEADALARALARGDGPAIAEKQTIVAYYLSQARSGLAAAESREP